VTDALEIGGDPDTICSIAMSLYGLFSPAPVRAVLQDMTIGV
jgi:ADP-ribosylglycohydrolase